MFARARHRRHLAHEPVAGSARRSRRAAAPRPASSPRSPRPASRAAPPSPGPARSRRRRSCLDPREAGGAVGVRAGEHDADHALAVGVGGRLEQHVDRRPRVLHGRVGRERERARPRRAGGSPAARGRRGRARAASLSSASHTTAARVALQQAREQRRRRTRRRGAARRRSAGARRAAGRRAAGSSASRPPQDAPITTSSYTSRDLPVEPLVRVELLVAVLVRREARSTPCCPSARMPNVLEAVVEQLVHAVLQRAVEVDQHVAAEDDVELVERAVGDEVVLREDDVARSARGRSARRRTPAM